jgi:hypothetical protein
MAGYRSSSDRDSGLRNGPRHGVSPSVAQLGRADSFPRGKGRVHPRADQGDLVLQHKGAQPQPVAPKPTPAQGQPPGQLPPDPPVGLSPNGLSEAGFPTDPLRRGRGFQG